MSNLFGIAQKYDYLVSQIEENDGEITEEIAEELAIAESELEDKLRAYRQIIDAQKANIAYNKDEIKKNNNNYRICSMCMYNFNWMYKS